MNEEIKEPTLSLAPAKKNLTWLFYAIPLIVFVIATMTLIALMASEEHKRYQVLESNVQALRKSIDDLDKDIKEQFESVNVELDKLKENDKAHTDQINGLNEMIELLKKDLQNKEKELKQKIDEVEQAKAEKKAREAEMLVASYPDPGYSEVSYTAPSGSGLNTTSGINNFNGHTESYYNLNMDRVITQARNFGIEGEYWVNPENGVKMYGDYVICACNRDIYPLGSLVETSFGTGISLDTGAFVAWNPTNVDIATAW